jgi:RNA polymerase sigma-70 factor (ECF subfamily)
MSSAGERTTADDDLVRRYLATRDEGAFLALYRAHTPYLYALASRFLGTRGARVDEVIQESWVRAAERLPSFDRRSALRTWLGGFVVNCCREERRRTTARRVEDLPGELAAPAAGAQDGLRIDLERALGALPTDLRRVLVLFDLAGYSHQEIHGLLDIAAGTSKSRLFAARRALRGLLAAGAAGTEARPETR